MDISLHISMNGGIHVKQKLPKLKISQQSRFLGKFFLGDVLVS